MTHIVDFATRPGTIDGLLIVTVKQITDPRGTVRELFRRSAFVEIGAPLGAIEQVNITSTHRGGVRGMHAEDMTKLVTVAHGSAHGIYVDLRRDSPTRGAVDEIELRAGVQVLVPSGVANGFQALDEPTEYAYCFDDEWRPDMPGSAFTPLDPLIVHRWPIPIDPDDPAQISVKDRAAATLSELSQEPSAQEASS